MKERTRYDAVVVVQSSADPTFHSASTFTMVCHRLLLGETRGRLANRAI